jgi:8-hydroxy-5-deazaflavin:NADPH oxidoreductase
MTRITILGSGNVATVLAPALAKAGHPVTLGSRTPQGPNTTTLAEAAGNAEVVINATPGAVSVATLTPLAEELKGKILIDLANAVEQGPDGLATTLIYPKGSLAEELQQALPETKVVKTLNTLGPATLMTDPTTLRTPPTAFLSGNDEEAKQQTAALLADLGWPAHQIIDLGDLTTARVPEAFILLVRPLVKALGPVPFALSIAH